MKILVVDDHALVREGLRQVLKGLDTRDESLEVLEADTCKAALELALAHVDLDLVLLDYHLPDMNGMEALGHFARQSPEMPVIMLSGSVNPLIMEQVLRKGASAFLTKSGLSDELLAVTRQVLDGQVVNISAARSTPRIDHEPEPKSPPLAFTPRQEEVLLLLMDGHSNKEIGHRLNLSDETVKNHISGILRGFDVQSRTQAVLAANRMGYSRPARQA